MPRETVKRGFRNGGKTERLWIDAGDYARRLHYLQEQLLAIGRRTGAEVVDPRVLTCDAVRCATSTASGDPLYIDNIHWRASFVRSSGFIQQVMDRTGRKNDPSALLGP